MKTLKLRDYQLAAILAIERAWNTGVQRPAVVLPTGSGKTVVFSQLIRRAMGSGHRPLVLVHREELIRQTIDKLTQAAPGINIGIVKAERHEVTGYDAVIASIQTLGRPTRLAATDPNAFDTIIVDECHHALARTWRGTLEHFGCFTPGSGSVAVGFTATMDRGDEGRLGDIWSDVVYTRDILSMVRDGYLTDVRGQMVRLDDMDMSAVRYSGGDYREGALAAALSEAGAPGKAAAAYHQWATRADGELRPGILFAPTVVSALEFSDAFNLAGIPTLVVHGDTPNQEREQAYASVRSGKTKVLSSCMVLTEGFDLPEMEVAVLARATTRPGLYVQMVGRVLRPSPWSGKTEALVLDLSGVSATHRLAGLSDLGGIEVACGENLTTAEKRSKDGSSAPIGREPSAGVTREIDLFRASSSAWLQTHQGRWFLPTREAVVFLWQGKDGTYRVGRTHTAWVTKGANAGWLLDGASFRLEMAMAWAEQEATELDPSVSSRGSSWRRRKAPASDAQRELLARAGIPIPDGLTKNDASDLLSIHSASRMIDTRQRTTR